MFKKTYKQLSFKYFPKSFTIQKLSSKASNILTTMSVGIRELQLIAPSQNNIFPTTHLENNASGMPWLISIMFDEQKMQFTYLL